MDFIHYTLQWCKGEILEASLFGVFGLTLLLSGIAFGWFGTTPHAKAMMIPLIVLGLIGVSTSVFGVINNTQRMTTFAEKYEADPAGFIAEEKQRVEGFEQIFRITYPLAIAFALGGLALFFLFSNAHLQAIGIALLILSMQTLTIDMFAAERGEIYYKHILQAQQPG
ncbi:hypothetical protein [Pseudovibrio sp. Alg231-02]|uniref:hypothetical protein n=1 Tax=Pseudovibrio sp. Alg231-02 TaxID=1922223 RepID=UPI000D54E873|nr:hypothetical protein [Pseudovibrio sp. Alg231-02]